MFTLYTKEEIHEWIEERIAISMEGSGLTEQEARRQADEDYLIELEREGYDRRE